MDIIQSINQSLPPIVPIKLRNEADYYGISHLIAARLGKAKAPRSFGYWTHGWIYTDPIELPKEINCWAKPKDTILVATQEQVDILHQFGYSKAHAVGMPFVYTDDPAKADSLRMPGSLLIMPAHSGSQNSLAADEEAYIHAIAQLKPFFSEIVACIHSSCVVHNYWIPALEKYKIPWVIGASVFDRNALQRMRTIFQQFEYMTTNTIGSHIPYSAYCGCKVSIYRYERFERSDYAKDPWYIANPDLLDKIYQVCHEDALRNRFPQFFVNPQDAITMIDWAKHMLGQHHQRSPEQIAELLGWSTQQQSLGYYRYGQEKVAQLFQPQFWRRVWQQLQRKDGFELKQIQASQPKAFAQDGGEDV